MVVTRSNTNGWSIARAASISCGPEQTPSRKIAPIPRRSRQPAEEILSSQTHSQSQTGTGTRTAEDSHPSAGRNVNPSPKRKRAAEEEEDEAERARKLPRVRLVVRPPRLFITIPRPQVLARIAHNNRTITLLGRRRISCAWRPAASPVVAAPVVPATRRSQRIQSRQAWTLLRLCVFVCVRMDG